MVSYRGKCRLRRLHHRSAQCRAGIDAHSIVLDVTDPATIAAAVANIERDYGRLDVLVNNAGTIYFQTDGPPSRHDWSLERPQTRLNAKQLFALWSKQGFPGPVILHRRLHI